jgi:uncharacterized protein with beta-barrel porin domain
MMQPRSHTLKDATRGQNIGGDENGKGYDFVTGGVALGVDYRLAKNFAIGIAAGTPKLEHN